MPAARILVLDGHDGSGKSTIAGQLARRLGWAVARPFEGAVSDAFYRCLASGEHATLDRIARSAVDRLGAQHAGGVVFDRHWLTMLSVLPPSLWPGWLPPPPTLVCWADPATTHARVTARGETRRTSPQAHALACARFLELAQRHGASLLDTSALAPDQALHALMARHPTLLGPWI